MPYKGSTILPAIGMNYLGKLSVLRRFKLGRYRLVKVRLFFSLLFFLPFALFAQRQKPTLGFSHLSVNDGLSENTVRAIAEDANGYMWFGSEDGLNRFDGYNFVAYHSDKNENTTLSSRNIKFMFNDSKKNLWILTSNGINIYDPQHDNFCNYRNNKFEALKNLTVDVGGITEDSKGNIWIGSMNDGLFKIESLHKTPQHYAYPFDDRSKHLLTFLSENDSTLWIGTSDGVVKFNPLTGQYTDCRALYGDGYDVRQIYKDPEGNIWLCTRHGLLKINPATQKLKAYKFNAKNPAGISGDNVLCMIPYKEHSYFIAVDGGGLDLFSTVDETFFHYKDELSSKNVVSAYKDSKGDLWVGTYLNGINYSNSTTNLFVLKNNNLLSSRSIKEGIVTRFLKDSKGDFWITTDGGGLYRKRAGQESYQNYTVENEELPTNKLISIIEDAQSNLWISTYGGGLLQYIRAKDQFKIYTTQAHTPGTLFNPHTKALKYFHGDVWVSGFGTGLNVFRSAIKTFEHFAADKNNPHALPSEWIENLYTDKKGDLWLCTFGGLSRYVPETNNFITFKFKGDKNTDVDINAIVDMTEDDAGNFWLGTLRGLICFNPVTHVYSSYTTKQGLSNNCIKSMVLDDYSSLWLATNNGVTLFNTLTRKAKAYTSKDGLPSCSFYLNSKYKDEQGLLYFGTNNGYLVIDPLLNIPNKKIPPIVITGFKISNKEIIPDTTANAILHDAINATKEITLPYDRNSISFEFSALNYNSSRNNRYSHWLEGFDEKYSHPGTQRTATYTNLDPGTYIFRVKGSNNDGLWNEQGAAIKIIILPPFWMTWWFYTILVLAAAALILLIHQWRIRTIRAQNILLEETVQQRTQDLREAHEQLETFVYRASHDIQGPLKSIMGLTILGKKDVQDEAAQTYFKHILTSTKKLDKLLTNLTQWITLRQRNLKKSRVDFRVLIDELLANFKKSPGYERVSIHVNIQDSGEFYSDYNLVIAVAENIIENAIKYADAEKAVPILNIRINATHELATLIFEDNGDGIPVEAQEKIFRLFYKANVKSVGSGLGLYIVKNAVEQLGGNIKLESTPGEGARFIVMLPSLKD